MDCLINKSPKLRHSEHSEESSSLNIAKKYRFFAMLRMAVVELLAVVGL
jgi:hypothetical protein